MRLLPDIIEGPWEARVESLGEVKDRLPPEVHLSFGLFREHVDGAIRVLTSAMSNRSTPEELVERSAKGHKFFDELINCRTKPGVAEGPFVIPPV